MGFWRLSSGVRALCTFAPFVTNPLLDFFPGYLFTALSTFSWVSYFPLAAPSMCVRLTNINQSGDVDLAE
jgi:hypothetical protein